jgi:hypothetical protein
MLWLIVFLRFICASWLLSHRQHHRGKEFPKSAREHEIEKSLEKFFHALSIRVWGRMTGQPEGAAEQEFHSCWARVLGH